MKKVFFLIPVFLIFGFILREDEKIRIFLAGDSTMSVKESKAYPETGWGMPFVHFFDSTIEVDNRARNGRSTKTFISEGRWQKLIEDVRKGDYVLIQFGHNDESKEKKERYTTPGEFKANLERFVNETKDRHAIPVLFTPVSRRKFRDGKVVETHEVYSKLVRDVAKELNVSFIDLDEKSRALYQQFGEEKSKLLFLQLQPGEHPNYPDGRNDNTHFNELGARLIAQIVLKELRVLHKELESHLVKRNNE